jgi:ABC-type uncharacterized transport system substrate-binding protein
LSSKRRSALASAFLAVTMLLLAATGARAHPHIFAQLKVGIIFNASGMATGIRQSWIFDEMFTAFALSGLGKNVSRETLAPLALRYGTSAKAFGYFVRARIGDQDATFGDPAEFTMDVRNEELVLEFTLPFVKPVTAAGLSLMFYDPNYYVALALVKSDAVELVGAPAQCTFKASTPDKVQSVDESYFKSLDAAQDWAARFATSIRIECPAFLQP